MDQEKQLWFQKVGRFAADHHADYHGFDDFSAAAIQSGIPPMYVHGWVGEWIETMNRSYGRYPSPVFIKNWYVVYRASKV